MRQTLIRVLLDQPWTPWAIDGQTGIEGVGVGIIVLVLGMIWVLLAFLPSARVKPAGEGKREKSRAGKERPTPRTLAAELGFRAGIVALLLVAASFVGGIIGRPSFPIFGYGFMTLVGFLAAILLTFKRARSEGFDPDTVFDLAIYVLVSGIVGGRLAYVVQYPDRVFGGRSGADLIVAAVNLSEGGLVLMGAMLGAGIGFLTFCHRRQIHPLNLADVVVPSAFVGIGFGRLGCLLNGCCFGDPSSLPWAITFPHGSVPFNVLAQRGFVDPDALATMPMHPTQIYSSLNGFILAFVTAIYFRHRRHVGDVLALALILYPLTRFTIEFLRNDELGKLGTTLTISQIYSLLMCAAGIGLSVYLNLRGKEVPTTTSVVAHGT